MSQLFTAVRIGSLTLPNRIAKTATSETMATVDGTLTDAYLGFYERVAAGGVGLVVTGNLFAEPPGQSTPLQAGIESDARIPAWRELTDAIHRHGARAFAQINHGGRQVFPRAIGRREAVSASDVREKLMWTRPRPMSETEIEASIAAFAEAARRARAAGFDGVQIHSGHGYLVSQFLSPYTNRRRDGWGGGLDARLRFLREVYRRTRERVGADFPIILKHNAEDRLAGRRGLTLEESLDAARALEREGLDGIEVTCGMYESGIPMLRGRVPIRALLRHGLGRHLPWWSRLGARLLEPLLRDRFPCVEGFQRSYANAFKRHLAIPVLCVGGFQTGAAMDAALAAGDCDVVSLGRALIADPELPAKLRDGRPIVECNRCNECIARAGAWPVACYRDGVVPEGVAPVANPAARAT